MTITNGYTTLAVIKADLRITDTDATDDTVIEALVEAASRYIDAMTGRTFYARTETRTYDLPPGRELRLDDDLLTVTTLTNGNDEEIENTEYILLPANVSPKYGIKLEGSSSVCWLTTNSGDTEQIISVAGTWGFASTTPVDIAEACKQIVVNAYKRRFGDGTEAVARITAAGVVITPQDIGPFAAAIIARYRKRL